MLIFTFWLQYSPRIHPVPQDTGFSSVFSETSNVQKQLTASFYENVELSDAKFPWSCPGSGKYGPVWRFEEKWRTKQFLVSAEMQRYLMNRHVA